MIKKVLHLLLFSFFSFNITSTAAQKNDFEYGLVNIGVGGVIGGVGALINKQPGQKMGKTAIKGFVQGALGGYLIFEGKRLVRKFSDEGNTNYIWPSKIVNAAGSSIVENAAANRNFWQRWHLNIGFSRIEIFTSEKFFIKYKILPFSLLSTINFFTNAKLDVKRTITYGTFVFTNDNVRSVAGISDGGTLVNSIILRSELPLPHKIAAHELIHTYQYENLVGINMFLNKPIDELKENSKYVKLYDKIFYTDFNAIFKLGIYHLEKKAHGYNNISFEKEAFYFGQGE